MFATFPYGGNGGAPSTFPETVEWIARTAAKAKSDERVQAVFGYQAADTPITMTRNAAVVEARKRGVDVIVMVDSDVYPDYELDHHHDKSQVPFWDAAFNFLYEHWHKGPVVIGAPYCGPPPFENVYVFDWQSFRNDDPSLNFKLGPYTREHAAQMAGIQPCGALPTGLIMFDVRAFDLTEPDPGDFTVRMERWLADFQGQTLSSGMIAQISQRCATERFAAEHSWFYYEYERDPATGKCFQDRKASTEDVTATRDIGLVGQLKLGYNPIHCAWSSWAGHVKPITVGKPIVMRHDDVAQVYRRAVENGVESNRVSVDVEQLIKSVA